MALYPAIAGAAGTAGAGRSRTPAVADAAAGGGRTLWNTVYLDAALARLRGEGYPVRDEDVVRLSAYMRRHLKVHGHYSFQLPDLAGTRRATPIPATTRSADRRRFTGAGLLTARRAVPDVPAA